MSVADEITKLEKLRESGALSEEEFTRAKARILKNTGVEDLSEAFSSDTDRLASYLHFSQLLGLVLPIAGFIAPPIIWAIYNREHPTLTAHLKNIINWILSVLVYALICGLLLVTFLAGVGILGFFVLMLLSVVFPIAAGMKANSGYTWRYPLSIPFLRQS